MAILDFEQLQRYGQDDGQPLCMECSKEMPKNGDACLCEPIELVVSGLDIQTVIGVQS